MFKTTTEEHNEQQVKYRNSMMIELGGIGYFKGAGTGVRTSFIQGSREHHDAGEGQKGLFPDSTRVLFSCVERPTYKILTFDQKTASLSLPLNFGVKIWNSH